MLPKIFTRLVTAAAPAGLWLAPATAGCAQGAAGAKTIEQSDLCGTQALSTPYGPMAIEDSFSGRETIRLLFDQRDRQRASEVYIWALPMVQFQQWKNKQESVYGAKGTDFVIYETFNEKGGVDHRQRNPPLTS